MAIFKKENGQLVDFSNPIPDTSIAPIENGATSTHNYVVGAYALVKGILKKVTNAISIGTAFSDSNSETTDVATELKELNDDVTTINTQLSDVEKRVDNNNLGDSVTMPVNGTEYVFPSDGYIQLQGVEGTAITYTLKSANNNNSVTNVIRCWGGAWYYTVYVRKGMRMSVTASAGAFYPFV
jgi:hypothetical protein